MKVFNWRVFLFIVGIFYIAIAMHLPISIYTTANYDDALFWNNAFSILKGAWLGSYNDLTLLKGVGFPLFLAGNSLIGWPITFSLALFHFFTCLVFINVLKEEFNVTKCFLSLLFIALVFHPYLFPVRVIRDDIYPGLTILFLCGFIKLFRHNQKINNIFELIPYGVAGGFFLLTREEGVWILPGVFVLTVFFLLRGGLKSINKKSIIRLGVFLLAIAFPIFVVSSINLYKYGKYTTSDSFISSGPYADTLKILNSIDAGKDAEIDHIPVHYLKRQEAYKVSPSFSQLKNYFESDGKWWTVPGCDIYPATCGDYAGGWFMFALRGAVSSIGFYTSPNQSDNFYKKIHNELNRACARGDIKCKTNIIPFVPRISHEQLKKIPGKLSDLFRLAIVQDLPPDNGGDSWGPFDSLAKVRAFLGNPTSMPSSDEKIIKATGWFYSTNGDWIDLVCKTSIGEEKVIKIDRADSLDLADFFNNKLANKIRFSITSSGYGSCKIQLEDQRSIGLDVSKIKFANSSFNLGSGQIHFNSVINSMNADYFKYSYFVKRLISKIYQYLIPIIFVLGVFAYLYIIFTFLLRKKPFPIIFPVITMCWVIVLSRSILLVMIDISSFPAINSLYFAPGFIFICAAPILAIDVVLNHFGNSVA